MSRLKREYDNLEEIGRGGFGVVYRARCIANGKYWNGTNVAIKKIDINKAPAYRVELELEALSRLVHDNIVKFYDQFQENGSQYIVMEYCKHRSLRDYVKKNGKMTDFSAAYILRQLVSAVKHIHENNMIHRDLSAGNVLISSIREDKLFVKLADFGLATTFRKGDIARTMLGTPGYIAPQVYGRHYNQKADVYSLGGILYLMLTGEDPPRDHDVNLCKLAISVEGAVLIQNMMDPDEERRIHLGDITMSDFMRKIDGLSLPMSRSREASKEMTVHRDYRITHHSPLRIRAHSAQPTTSGFKRVTKDSAFESGESAQTHRRRASLDRYRGEPGGKIDCRHSTYNENKCARCGKQRSLDRRYMKNTINGWERDVLEMKASRTDSKRASRMEQRTAHNAHADADAKKFHGGFIGHMNNISSSPLWPVDISRLAPAVVVRKAGRFTFKGNGTVIYEAAIRNRSQSVSRNRTVSDELLVKWIAILEKTANGLQVFSIYQSAKKCPVPQEEMPLIPFEPATRRTYSSMEELQQTTDKVDEIAMALYRKILNEVNVAGARAVKIIFKPTYNTTARLMENGDFRIKFQDGRLAVLKKGTSGIVVTKNDKTQENLSSEEKQMFEGAYKDARLFEDFLDGTSFQIIKPYPFHFSNNSQFMMNEIGDAKTASTKFKRPSVFLGRSTDADQQIQSKKYQSCDGYMPKQSRVALRDRNTSTKKTCQLVRMLADGEYTLRGQFDKNGVQIPTRIILNGSAAALELRISSNDPKIFVFKEGDGREMRFRFDGNNYMDVPPLARDLLFTLYQKRQKLMKSLNNG